MSRLNDLIQEAVEEVRDSNGCSVPSLAANLVLERCSDEDKNVLAREAATIRCKNAAASALKATRVETIVSAQLLLFPTLRSGYALDGEDHPVRLTEYLSEVEFKRLISLREKQIADDTKHLEDLKNAYFAAKPIWKRHPKWSFGQCCEALRDEGSGERRRRSGS